MISIHPSHPETHLHKHKTLHRSNALGQGNFMSQLEKIANKIRENFPHKDLVTIVDMLEDCEFNPEIVTNILSQETEQSTLNDSQISINQIGLPQQPQKSNLNFSQQQMSNLNNKGGLQNNQNQNNTNNQEKIKNRPIRKIVGRKPQTQPQPQPQVQPQLSQPQPQQQQQQPIQQQEQIQNNQQQITPVMKKPTIQQNQIQKQQENLQQQQQQQQQELQQQQAYEKKTEQLKKLQEKDFLKEEDMNQISQQIIQELQKSNGDLNTAQNILGFALNYVRNKISDNCVERNKTLYEENQVLVKAFINLNKKFQTQKSELQKAQSENDKLKDMGKHLVIRLNMYEQQQNFNNNNGNNYNPDVY